MATMKGADLFIQLLVNEGVEYVFGNPGATEILFMDALEKEPSIQYRLGLNEIVCAGMAEGYAKATGNPAFLNLHTGPGLAAAMPMLYNAASGGVPLVVTVGQQDTRLLGYDPHLTGDITGMGKLVSKWSAEVTHAEDLPTVIQRAFKMALQPPMGPVLVSIPQNVLDQPVSPQIKKNTTVYSRTRPDAEAIRSAVRLICAAKHPVIMVESGVAQSGAVSEAVEFAELIGAAVYQGWMSDVNFPVTHPQYLGDLDPTSSKAATELENVDLIIGVGCPLFAQAFYEPRKYVPENTRYIQVTEDPWEIGKNFPVDCGIQADIRTTLSDLITALREEVTELWISDAKDRTEDITELKGSLSKQLDERIKKEWENQPIAISRLVAEMRDRFTSDTIVVDDSWTSSGLVRSVLPLTKQKSYFRSRKGGSIGSGLSSAIGVQIAKPNSRVICVSGDGSAAWNMQSFWTAAKYKVPVTFVITNNAVYRQVKVVRGIVLGNYPLTERHLGMELDQPVIDFSQLARSLGVQSVKVSQPSDLGAALDEATASNEPRLIEVLVENRDD